MLHHTVMSDSAAPWTVARQAPLSMGFFRQEYWSRLPFPTLEDLPNPGTKPESLVPPALLAILYHWAAWEIPRLQQCMLNCSVGSDSLQPQGLRPTRPLCPVEFSRQEYWNVLPFPAPGGLRDLGRLQYSLCHLSSQISAVSHVWEVGW